MRSFKYSSASIHFAIYQVYARVSIFIARRALVDISAEHITIYLNSKGNYLSVPLLP